MLSCIVTALKFRAIQLLYLYGHSILLSMQITQVYDIAPSSILRVCRHFLENQQSILGTAEKCQKGNLKVSLFRRGVRYKAMCKSYYTHGKQSITLSIYCEPFIRALMASIPINCLFFQYRYEMDSEDRKTSLLNILHTTMLLNCEFTLGHLSQATELKKMDLLIKIAGFVFLSAALGMMKRHLENNQLWKKQIVLAGPMGLRASLSIRNWCIFSFVMLSGPLPASTQLECTQVSILPTTEMQVPSLS